jgi:membrane protein implicated in regulation of membrane protease activity
MSDSTVTAKDGMEVEIDVWAMIDGQIVIGEAKVVDRLEARQREERRKIANLARVASAATIDRFVLATSGEAWNATTVSTLQDALDDRVEIVQLHRIGWP